MHPHPDYQPVGTTQEQRCAACHAIIEETLSNEKFTPSGSTCNAGMRLEQIAFAPPSKLRIGLAPQSSYRMKSAL